MQVHILVMLAGLVCTSVGAGWATVPAVGLALFGVGLVGLGFLLVPVSDGPKTRERR